MNPIVYNDVIHLETLRGNNWYKRTFYNRKAGVYKDFGEKGKRCVYKYLKHLETFCTEEPHKLGSLRQWTSCNREPLVYEDFIY